VTPSDHGRARPAAPVAGATEGPGRSLVGRQRQRLTEACVRRVGDAGANPVGRIAIPSHMRHTEPVERRRPAPT
jgi:hypothetical protein